MLTFRLPLPPLPLPLSPGPDSRISSNVSSSSFKQFATISSTLSFIESSRNHEIQSLSKQGRLKQALQLLSREPHPTQLTYELLLHACSRYQSLSDAVTVHRHIINDGFDQDPFLATKLINAYSQLDSLDYARHVFHEIREKTIFVWNAFMRALALTGEGTELLCLYQQMNQIGVASDRFTYPLVLKACVVSSPSSVLLLREGKEIHGHILRCGFESEIHVATTLVDFYAKYGQISSARYVFDGISDKNVVCWSAMIGCYAKNNRPFEAMELFHSMIKEVPYEEPNSVTMVSVLQACSSLSALGQGRVVHAYILRHGHNSIISVMNALLTMYMKCGNLDAARCIFYLMSRKDVVSWNSMISGYGIHGFGRKAIQIFNEMTDAGIVANKITFVCVLGACSHAGLVEEGKSLFESMVHKYNLIPCAEHYSSMVDLLGRSGRLDEAAKIVEMMWMEPGPTVWGSLLGACRIHGNVELAERASVRLFELEPSNAGNYVLLADTYAQAKMWESVDKVKKLLEDLGLRKVPGCSWIEVKKKMHSFVSVDELNPQIEQLHALLVELSTEMKLQGYVPDTKVVLYELDENEKEKIVLGHSEKLALAFGLINTKNGETIRITKNLRLCEDCHAVNKFISKFANREIIVRDVNRFHHFRDGVCSCADYW